MYIPIFDQPKATEKTMPESSDTVSDLLKTIEQLETKNAQLQTELDVERQQGDKPKKMTIQERLKSHPNLKADTKRYLSGTEDEKSAFNEYYGVFVHEAQKLLELRSERDEYDNAYEVLNLGAALYHTGYGPPPAGLDYGYQDVVEKVKECLAREKPDDYYNDSDEDEEDEDENEDGNEDDAFRKLDNACGEFWFAWNR